MNPPAHDDPRIHRSESDEPANALVLNAVDPGRIIAEIEDRFRQSTSTLLSFYVNEHGVRVHVTLSRVAASSIHVERLTVRNAGFHGLTTREHEIATAIALGFNNEEIGRFGEVSKRTVDRHVSNVLTRLGFHNRAQIATLIAATDGWLLPYSPGSALEDLVPALGMLGGTRLRHGGRSSDAEITTPTLHIGSLLPADSEKQMEALAMSRGEDLAVTGTSADRLFSRGVR